MAEEEREEEAWGAREREEWLVVLLHQRRCENRINWSSDRNERVRELGNERVCELIRARWSLRRGREWPSPLN